MKDLLRCFIVEEEGQDLVEYAFLIVFIALAIIGFMNTFRTNIQTLFADAAGAVAAS